MARRAELRDVDRSKPDSHFKETGERWHGGSNVGLLKGSKASLMSHIENEGTKSRSGGEPTGQIELNGTFLVHPTWGWTGRDPIPGLPDTYCFQSQEAATVDASWPRMELVLDSNNLLPFHFLRTGDRLGRAVVKIQRDDGATGTGFLVAPDVILTNHHVLPTREIASTAVALANYEVSPANDAAGRTAVSPLDPVSLFVTNVDLDFTFCGVTGLAFLGSIPLDRERMHIAADETVTIIQHPRGRPKEISLRDNRVVRADSVVVQYSCDTEPGSSGSPVFNTQWKPVAIHHASVLTDSPEGRRIATNSRARYLNEGIRLSAVALWLETAEAVSPPYREQVARLRALFGGLNVRAGFFGALGRRSHGRSASELVSDSYKTRADVLDIGFWDTRALVTLHGGLREIVADLGRVIADMGLDLWCLSHADPAGLDALCEHLWAAYGLSYEPMMTVGTSATKFASATLLRPSRSISIDRLDDGSEHLPPGVRIKVCTPHGTHAEFQFVPLVHPIGERPGRLGERPHHSLAMLAKSVATGVLQTGASWIFVGESDLLAALEALGHGLLDDFSTTLAASHPHDGAVVLLETGASVVTGVFVSANLKPVLDPSDRLAVAHDRALPTGSNTFAGSMPFALRIALDPADPSPPERKPLVHITPPSSDVPRSSMNLDALIEQKIRDLLSPVVAKILADARDAGK